MDQQVEAIDQDHREPIRGGRANGCKEKGIEVKMPSKKGPRARNEIPIIEVNIDRMTGKKRIKIQKV